MRVRGSERTWLGALLVAALEVLPPAGQILLLLDGLALRVVERRGPGTAGAGCGGGLRGHAGSLAPSAGGQAAEAMWAGRAGGAGS